MSAKSDLYEAYESVAVSTRIRLARNFKDYPFPARLLSDPHAEEQASEIIRLVSGELTSLEEFSFYEMRTLPEEIGAFLIERNLISRDLLKHAGISAALISKDESISVMINEEDHIRAQYFMKGFDLKRAYERVSGIDDIISDSLPFAYDPELGYLTACPTNLGTGMRASVMLFLPAIARRNRMRKILSVLTRLGLTVRGASGEGSGAEGDLFQVSNEVTLGLTEEEVLSGVEQAVDILVETEILERGRMKAEEGEALRDRVCRSYGALLYCRLLEEEECVNRIADLKLGVTLGYFKDAAAHTLEKLDALVADVRPANIERMSGVPLGKQERDAFRAEFVSEAVRSLELL